MKADIKPEKVTRSDREGQWRGGEHGGNRKSSPPSKPTGPQKFLEIRVEVGSEVLSLLYIEKNKWRKNSMFDV